MFRYGVEGFVLASWIDLCWARSAGRCDGRIVRGGRSGARSMVPGGAGRQSTGMMMVL